MNLSLSPSFGGFSHCFVLVLVFVFVFVIVLIFAEVVLALALRPRIGNTGSPAGSSVEEEVDRVVEILVMLLIDEVVGALILVSRHGR